MALEQVEDESDFHCVTGWSRLDIKWKGVRVSTVIAMSKYVRWLAKKRTPCGSQSE